MTTAASTLRDISRFDGFLYAPVRDEANGTSLTVLSFLARLNIDPWDEAARLNQLPREAATADLATRVAALSDGPGGPLDAQAVAARLAALLPGRTAAGAEGGSALPRAPVSPRPVDARRLAARRRTVVYAVVVAVLLAGEWLLVR
jgi:hypothetical protein